METPSSDRDFSGTQVETPNRGIETLSNVNTVVQETSGGGNPRPQLTEPNKKSNEIQVRTENFEQENND